jgi:hypothetical protein
MLARMDTGAVSGRPVDDDACLRCGLGLVSMGVEEFRVGGTSGGWKMLFGEFAELGEDMLSMEVLACGACGRIELRRPATS